ncbi:MAG: hypothetical protein PHX31_05125 [Syntrophaceticus schinkii]|nr:hypothetical protein [Syntrophaceticus schinkii]
MVVGCKKCGLYDAQQQECYWFRKRLTSDEVAMSNNCSYFIEIIYEDGEPLTPYQHTLLKMDDLASKKMQGPI